VFRRKAVGASTDAQAVAANVDLAIIVCAFGPEQSDARVRERGLNARRVERYLRAAADAPARALLVVNKADLRADAAEQLARLRAEVGVEALLASAESGLGLAELSGRIEPGTTAVVLGSSGVGKSSLVNRLLGSGRQRVDAIRADDARGRHTTTGRELFLLPGGGILIDTPGMRELGLFADADTDLTSTGFGDIDRIAEACQFRDCRHQTEPGCAVRAAVSAGELASERLEHAHKLGREMAWQQERHALQQRRVQKRSSRRARGKREK
jgi:ribosome biogenesis GTPase